MWRKECRKESESHWWPMQAKGIHGWFTLLHSLQCVVLMNLELVLDIHLRLKMLSGRISVCLWQSTHCLDPLDFWCDGWRNNKWAYYRFYWTKRGNESVKCFLCCRFMITAAVSVSFTIGNVLSWRALAIIGLIPTVVLLFALQILRGKDADISEEAEEIQDYITTLERLSKSRLLELFHRRYLRSVTIGIGLMVCQQFGGINGICFYTSSIFELAGFSPTIGTITYACLQIVTTGLGAALIDKAGRKPLLLISGSGLVVGCMFAAVAFYLKVHEVGVAAVPALAVMGILVYIGSFSIGIGAIPWVVM
ncbi:hypothetical protein AAZX31_03G131300 [Glycine max]